MKNKKLTNKNTQVRIWLAILYPDDPNLKPFIETMKTYPNTLLMKHDAEYDSDNNLVRKEHYHFTIKFNSGIRLGTFLNNFGLDYDKYSHLFVTLNDINRKSFEDEIEYDTHIKDSSKKYYNPNLFEGGLRDYAISYINNLNKKPIDYFNDTLNFLKPYLKNIEYIDYTVLDYYDLCIKNHYEIGFYRNWSKFKTIIESNKYNFYK